MLYYYWSYSSFTATLLQDLQGAVVLHKRSCELGAFRIIEALASTIELKRDGARSNVAIDKATVTPLAKMYKPKKKRK